MGCDIHLYVEYRPSVYNPSVYNPSTNNHELLSWESGDVFRLYNAYDAHWEKIDASERDESRRLYHRLIPLWDDRCYSLFATLADVRNYSDITPICEPKGIPDDVCKVVKDAYIDWELDAHSASYYTLKELKDFYKDNKVIPHSGMVSPETFEKYNSDGTKPSQWCQATSNTSYKFLQWEDENYALKDLVDRLEKRARELDLWLPKDEENIRIVFWFDN